MVLHRLLSPVTALLVIILVAVTAWQVRATPDGILKEDAPTLGSSSMASEEPLLVQIEAGENAESIGRKLEAAGVIRSAQLFRMLVNLQGYEDRLQAGEYEFDRNMATSQVIARLVQGRTAFRVVTIPEGRRVEEVAEILEAARVVTAEEFLAALDPSLYDFPFLSGIPDGLELEGYLFPATYQFSRRATATEVVRTMLANMERQLTPEIIQKAEAQGLTVHQLLTLASIVEREAVEPEERPIIASVFLNRLRIGMRVEADPTVQYAIADDPVSVAAYGYWKRELTQQDLEDPSPYNTYVNEGLPPGPIANPGLASIEAVANPAETNYLYFVATGEGGHHAFAETWEEHLENVARYRESQRSEEGR